MKSLVELRLDNNSLTGYFPDLSALSNLTVVHLENNKLRGPLPAFLASLSRLKELYVQNNQLRGKIPKNLKAKKIIFRYDGNKDLTLGGADGNNVKLIIGIAVATLVLFVLIAISVYFVFVNYHNQSTLQGDKKRTSLFPFSSHVGSVLRDAGTEIASYFTLKELETATENFSRKIGQGSFGPVYYGKAKDGKEVAVKILESKSTHGTNQFLNEVALLSRIHHRNLVPLVGYCEERGQSILVYEYMHNGALGDHLHGASSERKALDWSARLLIAYDAAKGIEYLHNGCHPSIIHRDIKSSNILLDINMRARVSDFGLSILVDEERTHVSSAVRGTVGYLDPEYHATQQLTEKSDVYSFGVLLLELVSGRKPVSAQDYGVDWNIVHWARYLIRKGDIYAIIDPALGSNFNVESVWKIVEAAILSVEPSGTSRPQMQDIVQTIKEAIGIEKGNETAEELLKSAPQNSSQISVRPRNNLPSDLSSSFSARHLLPTVR